MSNISGPALQPAFRWAGGKRKLLGGYHELKLLPDYQSITSYVEPFLGAGALFCDIVSKSPQPRRYTLNDSNRELMSVYAALRDNPADFLAHLAPIEAAYLKRTDKEDRKAFYYAYRQKYWEMPLGSLRTAATLFFLLKTSFNGLWQTCRASRGRFGTPSGKVDEDEVIDAALLNARSEALKAAEISAVSFEQVKVPPGSFVYCDPPYRGGFAKYGAEFSDADQKRLIQWCDQVAKQGNCVLLTNRDLGDGFFERELPKDCLITRLPVTYTVGRKKQTETGFEAKPALEIVAEFRAGKRLPALRPASRQRLQAA